MQADGHRVVAGSLDGRGDDDATTVDGLAQLLLDRVSDRSSGDSAEEAAGVADLRGDLNDTGLQRVTHDAGVVDRGDLVTAAGSGDLVDLLLGTSGPLGGEATGDQVVAGVASLDLDDLAGLVAVFVFAGQMLNFPVGAVTSGHLLGGVLAAVLVGPWVATLCITVVLLVQALVFADGGLSAIGSNVTLMALVAVWAGWLVFVGLRALLPRSLASVPVAAASADEAWAWLAEHGVEVVATTPDTDVEHTDVDYSGGVAVAVGSEKYGLTAEALAASDHRVRIPMVGRTNSLNVATSAAIVLYEAMRQRGVRD